jgi:hypothetical protein
MRLLSSRGLPIWRRSMRSFPRCFLPAQRHPSDSGNSSQQTSAIENTRRAHRAGKKARAGWNPVGVIQRQPTGSDDTVDMGMKLELLIPGVQHTEEADFGPQMSEIAGDFEQCFCTGSEQQIVDDFLVLQS